MPAADLMSTAIDVLWRVRRSEVGGGGVLVWAPSTARSTRRTEAPQSASRRPANGPEIALLAGLIEWTYIVTLTWS